VRHDELEALVDGVVAAAPRGPFSEQPPSLQRLVTSWAADESERTGRIVTPEEFYRRGKTPAKGVFRPSAAQDEAADVIVKRIRNRD
jgi:hypothetical protein